MTIVTALPRNQAIIDFYAAGNSYKKTGITFSHGEHRIRAMIYKYEPGIMRTKSEQLVLSAQSNKSFCLEDLDQVALGPCAACGCEHVGREKTPKPRVCGLCVAAKTARVAWMKSKSGVSGSTTSRTRRKSLGC